MNTYVLLETKEDEYNWLVIATSHVSPLSILDELIKDLKSVSGLVLFDLTLINGIENNRYISAVLEHGSFVHSSFKVASNISSRLRNISRQFFRENPSIVDEGVISRRLKLLLKKGII